METANQERVFTVFRCAKCERLDVCIQNSGGLCFSCDPAYTCAGCDEQHFSVSVYGLCRSCDPETAMRDQREWLDHCETGSCNYLCEDVE